MASNTVVYKGAVPVDGWNGRPFQGGVPVQGDASHRGRVVPFHGENHVSSLGDAIPYFSDDPDENLEWAVEFEESRVELAGRPKARKAK